MGATLLNAEGGFTVDTPGFRAFAEIVKGWHDKGLTPKEVWLGAEPVNSCIAAFKSGQLVMCMSGSWQINGVAKDVADAFDWVVVPNPTGDGGSTGIAGGSAVVVFASSKHPQEAAKLAEFLMKAENYSAFSAGTLALPANKEVAAKGVEFKTDNPLVLAALAAYTKEVSKLTEQAVSLNVHPYAFAYYRNSANRIAQYLSGELTLDEMLINLQQDIDKAIAEAK
jgi:alpha-1,4-digalacturonate transport system substrate-binding protein